MATNRGTQSYEAFPMNPGDDDYSYAQNSISQGQAADLAMNMIKEAILDKLDIDTLLSHSSNVFNIADLGCSIGPNTFFAVQNITDFVKLKLQYHGYDSGKLEFHVFFNDHVDNDFNTLFKSLPVNKPYYAAGVPGSFHGRLFPESSLHFVHSCYALHWLSRVPMEVVDKNSKAYNKGKIYCVTAPKEVGEAYLAQFAQDMEKFLNSRALELVPGGLMAFLIPCPPKSLNALTGMMDILGNVLVDMANKGLLSDDVVDSFNLPTYFPTSEELKVLIEKNGKFSIEKMEPITRPKNQVQGLPFNAITSHFRAAWEGPVKCHFGGEIVEEIFVQFNNKLAEASIFTDPSYNNAVKEFSVVVKRNFVY